MQITFAPALSEKAVKTTKDGAEETTVEKYIRKEKEKKQKRREKAKASREGLDLGQEAVPAAADEEEDLGFDAEFFTSAEPAKATKSSIRKEERRKKREAREAEDKEKAAGRVQLELLMADNTDNQALHGQHFDMNQILRAEKKKSKKKKHQKDTGEQDGLQEDFQIDVRDARFQAMFEDHEFAIDPSDPKLKATPGMKRLLDERRKRTAHEEDHDRGAKRGGSKKRKGSHESVAALAQAVKKKSRQGVGR